MGKKTEMLTIRLNPDTLEFIDELRRKNSNSGEEYASRSETVRRIISDWAFQMTAPMSARLSNLVVEEEKMAEVLEDHGWVAADKEDGIEKLKGFLEDKGYEVMKGS